MKLFVGKFLDRFRRIIFRDQPEQCLAHALYRVGVREDFHAVAKRCVAGGDKSVHTFDLDRAGAAGTVGLNAVVVTKRRHFNGDLPQSMVDGEALGELVRLSVNGYLKHGSISVG